MAPARAAQQDRQRVADELAATAGEGGRATGKACAVLMVAAGGEPSDAEDLCQHAAQNRRATLASGRGEP
jgi:hypothetical protein